MCQNSQSSKPNWSSYLQHVFSLAKRTACFVDRAKQNTIKLLRILFPCLTNPTGTSPCMLRSSSGRPRVYRNVNFISLLFHLKRPPPLKTSFTSSFNCFTWLEVFLFLNQRPNKPCENKKTKQDFKQIICFQCKNSRSKEGKAVSYSALIIQPVDL